MTVRRIVGQVICLMLLALTVGACWRTPTPAPTETPTPVTNTPTPTVVTATPTPTSDRAADLSTERSVVQCRHPGKTGKEVSVGQHEPVGTGDEINTDQTGLGILTFADFLRVEVFRETGLQVKAAPDPDAPPIVKLYLALGTTLQELQKRAEEQVVVTTETDWATIESVATTYLISVDEDGVTSVVVYEGEAKVEAQQQTVILRPGKATYVKPREAPRPPVDAEMEAVYDWVNAVRKPEKVGSIQPVLFPSEDALIPTSTPTSTRTPIPTPTTTSTPRPADVHLISGWQISNLNPFVGEGVNVTFKVRNYGEQTFTARYFGIKGRGPGDSNQDFLWIENVSIAPGAEYTYSRGRSFSTPGEYWFTPHYSPDGTNWFDITWPDGQVSYVYITVQDNPPVVEEVHVEPATIYQGEEFRIKLIASDDIGLQSIRWRIEGTGDKYFDTGDEADCGGITRCEPSWDLKWDGKDGQFTVYAQARDTAGQLSSIGSTTITVLEPADVTVQSIDRIDVNCVTGSCTTTVVFTIANIGQASAGPFKVLIRADPALGQQRAVGINGLAAGATMTLEESLPADGNCYDPNCTVCITVNSGGYVVESNEANNELCETWIG
jgi:hypothetical protein